MEGACWYRSLGSSNTAIVELILLGGNCGNLTVLFDQKIHTDSFRVNIK